MGLNDIVLTTASLADLYPQSLVDTGDLPPRVNNGHLSAKPSGPGEATSVTLASPPDQHRASVEGNSEGKVDSRSGLSNQLQAEPELTAQTAQVPPAKAKAKSPLPDPGPKEDTAATLPAGNAQPTSATLNTDTPAWKYLGNNKKHVLIVVDYEGAAYLPDDELAFLTKMLTACKLGLGDVAIVNSAHYPKYSSADYLRQFRSQQVLLFGRDPESFGLPLAFPQFQVQAFAGVTFLSSPPLGEMMDNTALKSTLWASLKRIFTL